MLVPNAKDLPDCGKRPTRRFVQPIDLFFAAESDSYFGSDHR